MANTRPCLSKRRAFNTLQYRNANDRTTAPQIGIGLSGRYLSGSAGRIRTYDQVVNSHPLCQLSYRGINNYINEKSGKNQMRPRRQRPYTPTFLTPAVADN